ncbi:MAG: primosomal protein N' [Prevotella sp.]|nr:primosomal protein N' [Staphylococcus sp.]MCM1350497.1 primosomal protein N' [Prevotella sp.]
MVVQVVINVSSSQVDQEYTYLLPDEMSSYAQIGSRVKVPFGDANRIVMGYILDIQENMTYTGEMKSVCEVVDYYPLITSIQIELAKKIKDDAVCPLIRILNLMIPKAMVLKTNKYLTIQNYMAVDATLAKLFVEKETIPYTSKLSAYDTIIAKEIKKGNIKLGYDAIPKANHKMIHKYVVNQAVLDYEMSNLRSEAQKEFLSFAKDEAAMTKDEWMEKCAVSSYCIDSLYKKGFLNKIQEKASRVKVRQIPIEKRVRNSKDSLVQEVLAQLEEEDKPILFVPSSEDQLFNFIYQTIHRFQIEKKNVVILTPEILNSYRVSSLIRQKTGLSVAVINSDLSDGERLDIYNEILHDEYSVIVTTATGALYPFQNVGIFILLDIESDNYYNDQSPRYNLKLVMEQYARLIDAKLIFSSFSPNILDYTYGLKQYYHIIQDHQMVDSIDIEVIDMKQELRMAHQEPISTRLYHLLKYNIEHHQVSMLVVGNKHYSSFVMCRSCGEILKCSKCNISLQYHKKRNLLICPSCSKKLEMTSCPTCSSNEWQMGGMGIEQIDEQIKKQFPTAKVTVLSETNYQQYYSIMGEIEEGNLDILITTPNYAKSIESSALTLIGVLNLDATSRMASFDASEKAYQMLVQLKNRLSKDGISRLIIQTYNSEKDDFLIDFLTSDYYGFVKNELQTRKVLRNEPYYYINRIIVKTKYEEMFKEANQIKMDLQRQLGNKIFVLGPTYNYQFQGVQIIVKHRINEISEIYKKIYKKYQSTSTTIIVDKYPKYV